MSYQETASQFFCGFHHGSTPVSTQENQLLDVIIKKNNKNKNLEKKTRKNAAFLILQRASNNCLRKFKVSKGDYS